MSTIADIATLRDRVYSVFATAWATLPAPPPVIYADQDKAAPEDGSYVDVGIQHTPSGQATLGGVGEKLWTSHARLVCDIYNAVGDGLTTTDVQTKVLQAAFRGKKTPLGDVWFRAVRVTEMPPSGSRSKTRVVVDLTYDERV